MAGCSARLVHVLETTYVQIYMAWVQPKHPANKCLGANYTALAFGMVN
jgi:hypothetical protein